MRLFRNLLTGIFSICTVMASAQGLGTFTHSIYPIQIDYPNDGYELKGGKAKDILLMLTDGQTEFYIQGMNVGPRFDADSLKAMMTKLYTHPDIKNLQVNEIGSGTMGKHAAERLVMSFTADEKLYIMTSYLVYFHVNHELNAFLFSFEIGENNVRSYVGLQEFMIESIRYTDFKYIPIKEESFRFASEMPDFWRARKITDETQSIFSIDDNRGNFQVEMYVPKDSSTASMTIDSLKTNFKNMKEAFPNGKIKTSTVNFLNEKHSMVTITYDKDIEGLKRKTVLNRIYLRRMVSDKEYEFLVSYEFPEYYTSYYQKIFDVMLSKTTIEGVAPAPIEKDKKPKTKTTTTEE